MSAWIAHLLVVLPDQGFVHEPCVQAGACPLKEDPASGSHEVGPTRADPETHASELRFKADQSMQGDEPQPLRSRGQSCRWQESELDRGSQPR